MDKQGDPIIFDKLNLFLCQIDYVCRGLFD